MNESYSESNQRAISWNCKFLEPRPYLLSQRSEGWAQECVSSRIPQRNLPCPGVGGALLWVVCKLSVLSGSYDFWPQVIRACGHSGAPFSPGATSSSQFQAFPSRSAIFQQQPENCSPPPNVALTCLGIQQPPQSQQVTIQVQEKDAKNAFMKIEHPFIQQRSNRREILNLLKKSTKTQS